MFSLNNLKNSFLKILWSSLGYYPSELKTCDLPAFPADRIFFLEKFNKKEAE